MLVPKAWIGGIEWKGKRCPHVGLQVVAQADKLLRLEVDCGEGKNRQIFSGIRSDYADPAALVGKKVVVIANLKPRQMKFGLSEGMVLAAGTPGGSLRVCTFDEGPKAGDRVS